MEKRTSMIRADGQLPAHFTVTLTVARSSSAEIMAMIAETSRLWLIVGRCFPILTEQPEAAADPGLQTDVQPWGCYKYKCHGDGNHWRREIRGAG